MTLSPRHQAAASAAYLMLIGCVNVAAPASPSADGVPDAWFALGTEPYWSVEITDARIAYNNIEDRTVHVANPGAQPSFNGRRYVTSSISVDITSTPCRDGMSDRRYADTVTVEVDGATLHGCGGRVLPPTHLDDTNWHIISVDGATLPTGRSSAELRFSGNQISGSVGCNRLSGAFSSDGNRLTIGRIASTRMACDPALTALEARLSALLGQSLAMRFDGRGRMTLTGNDDAQIVLERII